MRQRREMWQFSRSTHHQYVFFWQTTEEGNPSRGTGSEFDDAAGGEPVVDRRQVEDRDTKQKEFGDIFLNLSALVKVLNSHKTKVNVLRYKELSMETYKLIVTAFPWCHVPESIHRVLGHAWERIEGNDSFGLGSGTKIQ